MNRELATLKELELTGLTLKDQISKIISLIEDHTSQTCVELMAIALSTDAELTKLEAEISRLEKELEQRHEPRHYINR